MLTLKRMRKVEARKRTYAQPTPLPRFAPNPHIKVNLKAADGVTDVADIMFGERHRKAIEGFEEHGIPLNVDWRKAEFWGYGKEILYLRPQSETIWFYRDPDDLTLAQVLVQLADGIPQIRDWGLVQFIDDEKCHRHGWTRWCGQPLGMTLSQYRAELKLIEEDVDYRTHDGTEPRHLRYFARRFPADVTWYHATLAKNVESILAKGLLPSTEVEGGWSPSWNWGIQRAVYLTSDLDYAVRIAEHIAQVNRTDGAIIMVDGAALADRHKLVVDEDAVRDEYDGSVNMSNLDVDFPEYETSWHSINTLGYAGTIPPKYLALGATGKLVDNSDEYFPDDINVEWSGYLADEIS